MAVITENQNVANSPTNAYPVGVFKMANGTELQGVVLVNSTGEELQIASGLVPETYDEIDLTYTGDNITTVVYKLASVTVATLTLTYTGDNLTNVVRS